MWWIGLPWQRAELYRRATAEGNAVLGLEFLTSQQVYYRMLARARRLKPLLTGNARLVAVGQALAEVARRVPAPGEARLFAYAIAEAKRFGVTAHDEIWKQGDAERERFRAVYEAYERLTAGSWDYDDCRTEALELVRRDPTVCEAEVVIVDGYRELGPLEHRIFSAIGELREVLITLPEPPPGDPLEGPLDDRVSLPPGPPATIERYRAANPVEEARWVFRSVKRDLAIGGFDPLDLAIVTPPGRSRGLASLAEEYGLPLMDETPTSLTDGIGGRALLELLELAEYPTASRLLVVPELADLANAVLEAGVAGADAVMALATPLGQDATLRRWLAELEVGETPLAWARHLVQRVLPRVLATTRSGRGEAVTRDGDEGAALDEDFVEAALRAAQEASRLATGASYRAWWGALLQQPRPAPVQPGGVTLLTADQLSGRRFRRLYLVGAVAGAYDAGESEDYFVPEEDRATLAESFARLGLPRRFQGRGDALAEDLLSRAETTVVTYAEADQGGPLVADEALVLAAAVPPLPPVPAGSPLELPSDERYRATLGPVELRGATVDDLQRYDRCAFRYWGEERVLPAEPDEERAWWRHLRRDLTAQRSLDEAGLARLADGYPEAATWLTTHAERLRSLTFGVRLQSRAGDGPSTTIDAAVRDGDRSTLYRFVEPTDALGTMEARERVRDRWASLWAAGFLIARYPDVYRSVGLSLWPILGEPVEAYPYGVKRGFPTLDSRAAQVERAYQRLRAGDATPSPGYVCRDCPVFDVCREGVRS